MKKLVVVILLLILLASPLLAIFGVGDIVHDPISYLNAVLMLQQLIQSYDQLKAQSELQAWMSQMVPVLSMAERYRTYGNSWYDLQIPFNRFGNLSGWLQAVNSGEGALDGYGRATVTLQPYGQKFSQLHPEEQAKAASNYASIELADGLNVHNMEAIGELRGSKELTERRIENLTEDSLSMDPEMNTLIAVLNKINAASIAILRSSRDTNRGLLGLLEQQVAESKLRRDSYVSEVNAQIMRQERADEIKASYSSTLTESLRSFRWR
jgi:hypothetical protein